MVQVPRWKQDVGVISTARLISGEWFADTAGGASVLARSVCGRPACGRLTGALAHARS